MKLASMLLAFVALALTGCEVQQGKLSTPGWMTALFTDSFDRELADTIDMEDADRRREGVVALSRRKNGLEEPYLKAYALLAEDPDPSVRCAAINALGRAGKTEYVPVILTGLSDPVAMVRLDAAEALGRVPDERATGPLSLHSARDDDPHVRIRCIRALGHYKHKDVLNTLINCLSDEQFGPRLAAREVLREMTGLDGAYDVAQWHRLLAGKKDPFAPVPTQEPKRSWWKLLG